MVTKINPQAKDITVARSFLGKTITVLNVDYVASAAAEYGLNEAIFAMYQIIGNNATIVATGPTYDSDSQQQVWVEGEFPTDTYDGTNSETFGAWLTTEAVLLGATYGENSFDMTAVVVTTVNTYFADQVDDTA